MTRNAADDADEGTCLARTVNRSKPPAQAAPDADAPVRRFACLTVEDGVYEHANGEHVAYADYAKLLATIEQQTRELADARAVINIAAHWLHAAFDRPPQPPEAVAMLAAIDAAKGAK